MKQLFSCQPHPCRARQLTCNGRQVEAAQLQRHPPGGVAAAFAAVLADDGCLPRTHPAASSGGGGDSNEQLRLEARKLVAGLRAAAPTLPCAWDASLPADPGKCVAYNPDRLSAQPGQCASGNAENLISTQSVLPAQAALAAVSTAACS